MLRSVLFGALLAVLFVSPAESASRRHVLEVGAETYAYNYEETISENFFMEMKGQYSGLFANYMFRPPIEEEKFLELRLEGRWASGSVDYKADDFGYDGLDDYMFEIRGLAGMAFILPNGSTVTPSLGVGYRYLNNGFEKVPAEATGTYSGYNRESRYEYIPLRVDWMRRIKNSWELNINLELDMLLDGEQKSHLEDLRSISGNGSVDADTVTYKQNRGYGWRGSLRLSKALKIGMDISLEPFFRHWNIGDSDYQTYMIDGVEHVAYEPGNTTLEIGAKIGVVF